MRIREIGAPVRFNFDGLPYVGQEGDTLASALLANGVRLVGRSFKYHRPRGILTAGIEEPNALVTVGDVPNERATMVPLVPGLAAQSQNAWPSVKLDLLALNDLAAPFLGAGFYYKTFMWPRRFWEGVYEPLIRRAAGLGKLSGDRPARYYEKAFAFCDLLVIGGGPAGLMAALTAGRAGVDVILAEEDMTLGGRLLVEQEEIGGQTARAWRDDVVAELEAMENVRLMSATAVTGAYDGGTYGALTRRAMGETFWRIVAGRVILAAGATERHIAFPDNDRPGIMSAGAVRAYVNRWGVAPGKRIAVFTNNDDGHRTARDLHAAGVEVVAVIDTRRDVATSDDYRVIPGGQVVGTEGRTALRKIMVQASSEVEELEVDCLAVSGGWNPNVHLTCHMNGRPLWREDIAAFVPQPDMIPGLEAVGACNGALTTKAALVEGAQAAARVVGGAVPDVPGAEDAPFQITPVWVVEGKGRAWLDFQNDVTVKDVRQAAAENFQSVEHMKRYTTQGMATDQGKVSNVTALAVLADATGRAIPETGTTTFRPPYSPVSIAALGAGAQGKGFQPERRTPADAVSREMGAPMIAVGLWYRPSYYPRAGERHWRVACNREVTQVRNAVGVADVSTLGKIDIQGPDAGALLDFVYTGRFSTLAPGRLKYGAMLREDGHVMDDGTCARLGEAHFLISTTTAAAGQVMQHLDFVTQVLRPDWDVQLASVTDQWAQYAVTGPKANEVLGKVLDDWRPEDWPFLSCGPVDVQGVKGRLFRVSFSGELGFELAVPARYGASLFRLLIAEAETLGGGAYGMEALNVLRIEKGFITHAEIDGRATLGDVGMGRMMGSKDCIGKRMAARPGLTDPERPQLVGLKPAEGRGRLTVGAHLFRPGVRQVRENEEGRVSSAGYSPTLGHQIALGFLTGGLSQVGERLVLRDQLRDVTTEVEVTNPVFYDPEGGRARA